MMNELIRKAEALIDAWLENMPSADAEKRFPAGSVRVAAGTEATLTFAVDTDLYQVKLTEIYADAVPDLDYTWIIDGISIPSNQQEFYMGQVVQNNIVLVIGNPTAVAEDIGYRMTGWGNLKK